jgi:hypothetical protein
LAASSLARRSASDGAGFSSGSASVGSSSSVVAGFSMAAGAAVSVARAGAGVRTSKGDLLVAAGVAGEVSTTGVGAGAAGAWATGSGFALLGKLAEGARTIRGCCSCFEGRSHRPRPTSTPAQTRASIAGEPSGLRERFPRGEVCRVFRVDADGGRLTLGLKRPLDGCPIDGLWCPPCCRSFILDSLSVKRTPVLGWRWRGAGKSRRNWS